ncbi:MAG: hypothetical protein ACTSYZ_08315 [Candidatus Helarchaeota archaeon]
MRDAATTWFTPRKLIFSNIIIFNPASAIILAAVDPAKPAPEIITSYII